MNDIDVFISRKSTDAIFAKNIYEYLSTQGLSVFDSDHTLKELGNADYIKAIDEALVRATHMIVVGSSAKNIKSSWVEAEWLFFLNRKRSGKTSGNLFTVITKDMAVEDVPPSLANYEVMPYNEKNFPIIYNYVRAENTPSKLAPKKPFPAERQNKLLRFVIGILLATILSFTVYYFSQPYDATLFLRPDPQLKLKTNYPPFRGGELVLYIDNKEERKQILSNGEVVFKQIPASFKNKKVAVKLYACHWKTATDSIMLNRTVNINLYPDGSLERITGNITIPSGTPLQGVTVNIGNDTSTTTNDNGFFDMILPVRLQDSFKIISFEKTGFETKSEYYFPKSGRIDVQMKQTIQH